MNLPGEEVVERGLADLDDGVESIESLLVSIGAPRLRELGLELDAPLPDPEERLFLFLARDDPDGAHARYNALVRRLVSFERAAECAGLVDAERLDRLLRALGEAADEDGICYLVGGATAVYEGWRATTVDAGVKLVPEQDSVLRAIPAIKNELRLNVETAWPGDFIPLPSGWEGRSPCIGRHGRLAFAHLDPYSQALAKLERAHARDREDVAAMADRALVDRRRVLEYFAEIEPLLYRFPAIDPAGFRRRVEAFAAGQA